MKIYGKPHQISVDRGVTKRLGPNGYEVVHSYVDPDTHAVLLLTDDEARDKELA